MLEGVVFIGTLKLKNPFGGLVVSVTTKPPSGLLSDGRTDAINIFWAFLVKN